MRHQKRGRKFHREKGQRIALTKHLLNNLFSAERIITTEAKAKEIRPYAERVITAAKRQDLTGRRFLLRVLPKKTAMKVYHEIAPRYAERHGGYTRLAKASRTRVGDGSRMAAVELV